MLEEFRQTSSVTINHGVSELGSTVGTKPLIDSSDLRSETMISLVLPEEFSLNNDTIGKAGQRHPLQDWLWEKHRIEIPIISWGDQLLIRVSAHLYNSPAEHSRLAVAVREFARQTIPGRG
jgi:isopenicillin-N epimerase